MAVVFQILLHSFLRNQEAAGCQWRLQGSQGRTRPFTAFNFHAYFFSSGLEIVLVVSSVLTAFPEKNFQTMDEVMRESRTRDPVKKQRRDRLTQIGGPREDTSLIREENCLLWSPGASRSLDSKAPLGLGAPGT